MNVSRPAAVALAVAVLTLTTLAPAGAAADPQAAQVIAASGKALGVSSLRSVNTIRIDGAVSAAGLTGTATQYADIKTGQFAESTNLAPLVQLDGYDGRVTWNADGTHLVWTNGGDSEIASEINQAYLAALGLWQPQARGATVASLGKKTADGKTYDALRITPVGSKVPFELWFDSATHLPAKALFVNGFTTATTTFSDYRRVHGVMIPYKQHVESSDGNNADVAVHRVAVNPPGAQAALARPQTKPTDFSIQGGTTSTTVPIALGENHVYLDVMLDGKGPYRFIFDTGGSNVVDPAVAKEIGAFGQGSAQGSGVGSQTENFSFANISTLQVGDAVLKDQLFAIAPTRQGFGMSSGSHVDGLIGWEVLARFITTFDYANDRVTLALPGTATPPAGGHVVPFVLYGTQPQIACTIDGIPSECTIDTGARDTISFMTPFVADHPQVMPATTTAVGIDGFGIGGPSMGKLGRVQDVGIDDFHLQNLVGDYSAQNAGALAAPFVAANIGGNLLRRFTVTFDYYNGTMTLVPNAAFAEPDAYERSGLFLINRAGTITIVDARPGTPAADAGLVKGDVITAVNGAATSTMTLGQIRDLFAQPAGSVVTLDIAGKDGSTRTVKLTLRDYV
jgi:hypothetical protein